MPEAAAQTPGSPANGGIRPVALTMAGSDSGGGAGIQADLRTFTAAGCFGSSVITCVTAQNLDGVTAVEAISPAVVRAQIEAVLDGFPVRAAKTGMLFSREIILEVAAAAERPDFPPLVVDPVMVAASGARLLQPAAEKAYREALLPRAAVITPNLDEAEVLLGRPVLAVGTGGAPEDAARGAAGAAPVPRDAARIPGATPRAVVDAMRAAAEELARRFGTAVFLKGGHLPGDPVDVLVHGGGVREWTSPRVEGVSTHGSGCTLSAAVAAWRARGATMEEACAAARDYLQLAFRSPVRLSDDVRLPGGPAFD